MHNFFKTKTFAALAAGLVGVGIGGASGSAPATEPARTAVTERRVEVPVEKVVEVEKPVTPQSCRDALRLAREGFALAGEGFGYSSDAMRAAGNFDPDGIDRATRRLNQVTDKTLTLAPKFNAAATTCEGS